MIDPDKWTERLNTAADDALARDRERQRIEAERALREQQANNAAMYRGGRAVGGTIPTGDDIGDALKSVAKGAAWGAATLALIEILRRWGRR